MRCLITGGMGFIGSNLGNKLIKLGHEVTSLDNLSHAMVTKAPYKNVQGDICKRSLVDALVAEADIVFHLAAEINIDYSMKNPNKTVQTNVIGTMNVLNAVTKHKKRMVFASSSEVYGTAQQAHMTESHQLDVQSPYAATKAAADRMCKAYAECFGTEVIILRNFNTFGENQRDDSYGGVISKFCKNGSQGIDLQVFGNGKQTRDYMYASDAVQAYLTVMEHGDPGETYNAGTGHEVSVNHIAETISRHYNVRVRHIASRPAEVWRLCADTKKIESLGWKPKTRFDEKLNDFITWYDSTLSKTN